MTSNCDNNSVFRLYLTYGRSHFMYTTGKIIEYLESAIKHSYMAWWFARNGLTPTTNKYGDFEVTLICCAMDEKWNLQCPKFTIHNRMYKKLSFFNTPPRISNNFQGIHHYNVNLWKLCGCSLIRYRHHANLVNGRRITIWALKTWQKGVTQGAVSCHLVS